MREITGTVTLDIHQYWDETIAQTDPHGRAVYPHKRSLVSYYNHSGARTSGVETSVETIDPTTVGDSSYQRIHKAWPLSADENPLLLGLRRLIFEVLEGAGGDPGRSTAMQTAYRVSYSEIGAEDGDPGPEGVHQDIAELTAVVLIGRDNVCGGVNRVWSLEQPCGKPSAADLLSDRLLTEVTMETPLDCLLVLDRKVKHEVSSIGAIDPNMQATRDVLTFEVRPTEQ